MALAASSGSPPEGVGIDCRFPAKPFPEASLDLVALPPWEFTQTACDPAQSSVFVPEGRLSFCRFNPASHNGDCASGAPCTGATGKGSFTCQTLANLSASERLRDWLRLLKVSSGRCPVRVLPTGIAF